MITTFPASFTRHTRIATSESCGGVHITVKWKNGNLSITGVEGPMANGNCRGGCGQIDIHEWADYTPCDGIDLNKIRCIWKRWHLNDMKAGDSEQEEWLRVNGPGKDYTETCEKLKAVGLYEHNGYKYGHAWKREEVPADVVEYLYTLPETDKLPSCWR